MDLNMSVSAIGLAIFLFTVLLSFLLGWARKNNERLCLPGPFALPIIGNLHQLGALPHRGLQRLAEKHGPIMLVKMGSVPVVVASSSQAAKQFLKTHDLNFASRPSTVAGKYLFYNRKDIVFAPYGAYWRNIRKICMMELLSAQRIDSFKGVREEEALAMVRSIWEKSEQGRKGVDVSHSVACYTSDLMWRILTGRTNADRLSGGTTFEELVWEGNELMGAVNIGDFIPCLELLDLQGLRRRTKNVHQRLDAVFDKIIDEHVERKGRRGEEGEEEEEERQNDLVDVLVDMEITVEEKKAILMDMFLAAIESSASTVEWAMSELLRNPHVMKKLQGEIDFIVKKDEKITSFHIVRMEYLHCVVKETSRLYPIGPLLIPHESTEDCLVEGPHHDYFIPTKTRLIINAWAIGRDPKVWENPFEFRPERFMDKNFDIIRDPELSMIPFGAGRRSCPGASMAIANMEIALGYLVHYLNWKCEGELDMKESFGITIPKKVHLFAIPTLRLKVNEPSCSQI
ncbi:cytochrome P450 750A1-like [Cryptomeria japonica]|uniref:cytochrome P450 750A1-like n=1 Tax=Cryptomeria japonica TaxID=3369 RepID=UPI0027D9DCA7|nr:cytochrome P450 750A1-like [Cryptomeria japonica]